ncbi:hypothetical protein [Pyrobaculum neutrophilum]|uniref:Uncharacterized protein n=1 Tax=Pyrobaculum neutrophilum (strain DSM 2338 / JCM 9278 / NBRC 100436 / V24Sta) TaxID=444157 RepID=B1YAQ8_PYRNV|nr:hypothetical protein [Pyrobaculum neutrophilum]ACB39137.1 conserved hypothetical protein [Pyrobaculum neutrophilum V24Sta]
MPLIKTYIDERGEPRARIVDEGGRYVISLDVFKQLERAPPDTEVLAVGERYRILVRRRSLLGGVCEFVYFQFPGGVQLINAKYVGPDDPDAAIEALLKAYQEEVSQGEKDGGNK